MSGLSYNPYITNIIPIFNVSSNNSGSIASVDYSSQIIGFESMIDYTNNIVSTDIIKGYSDTQVTVNSDLLIDGSLIINSYPIGPDTTGSNFTSGTAFTVQTTNMLNTNVQFIVNNNTAFAIDSDANSLFSGTITCQNVVQVSDRRLKTNIFNISNCLSTLMKLEAIQYTMNNVSSLGFIAQDVYEVLPTIVNTSKPYWSIDYTQLIPLLVESVKELSAEVKLLRERN